MKKTFKCRIYPTKHQKTVLNRTPDICRTLSGNFDDWCRIRNTFKVSLSGDDQSNDLTDMKAKRPALKLVHSQVLREVDRKGNRGEGPLRLLHLSRSARRREQARRWLFLRKEGSPERERNKESRCQDTPEGREPADGFLPQDGQRASRRKRKGLRRRAETVGHVPGLFPLRTPAEVAAVLSADWTFPGTSTPPETSCDSGWSLWRRAPGISALQGGEQSPETEHHASIAGGRRRSWRGFSGISRTHTHVDSSCLRWQDVRQSNHGRGSDTPPDNSLQTFEDCLPSN